MRTLDKFEKIAWDAQYAVAIIGNPASSRFALLDLDSPCSEETRQELADTGCYFLGAIGIVEGLPKVALSEPLEPSATSAISQAFLQLVERRLNANLIERLAGDVQWLENLYRLQDGREN